MTMLFYLFLSKRSKWNINHYLVHICFYLWPMFPAFPCRKRMVGGAVCSWPDSIPQLSLTIPEFTALSDACVLHLWEYSGAVTRNICSRVRSLLLQWNNKFWFFKSLFRYFTFSIWYLEISFVRNAYRMYMFSKDKPNIDGDGTKTLAVAGWSGWYKSLSPAW